METDLEKVQTRISSLIAKAERTEHLEEARSFYAAAEMLMLEYNLELEQSTTNRFQREEIVRVRFKFSGPALYWIPWSIGAIFIVAAVDRVALDLDTRHREFVLYGTEADTEYVERLLKSAWRSALNHMKREIRDNTGYLMVESTADKSKFRKSFIEGYGIGVAKSIESAHAEMPGARLALARRKNDIEKALADDGVAVKTKTIRSRTLNRHAYEEGYAAGNNSQFGKAAV